MMNKAYFNDFLRETFQSLKKYNFKKKNNSFYFSTNNNFLIFYLQKHSQYKLGNEIFTLNIGIYIHSISVFMGNEKIDEFPHCSEGQFYDRIGLFINQRDVDFWWRIKNQDDFNSAIEQLYEFINKYLDFLMQSIEEKYFLENFILNNSNRYLTLQNKYIYGAYLAKATKYDEVYQDFINKIKAIIAVDSSDKTRRFFKNSLDRLNKE